MEGRVEKEWKKSGKGGEARFFYPKKPLNENSIGRVRRSWKNDYVEPIFEPLSTSLLVYRVTGLSETAQ